MTDDIRYPLCHKSGKLCVFSSDNTGPPRIIILRPPTLVRMRVRVRIRVHVTGGVLARGLTYVDRLSEQPHWRWPNQGAAVAKQGGLAS